MSSQGLDPWAWSDGSAFDFTSWSEGEPNNLGSHGEPYIHMWRGGERVGKWNDNGAGFQAGATVCSAVVVTGSGYSYWDFDPVDGCVSESEMNARKALEDLDTQEWWPDFASMAGFAHAGGAADTCGGISEDDFKAFAAKYFSGGSEGECSLCADPTHNCRCSAEKGLSGVCGPAPFCYDAATTATGGRTAQEQCAADSDIWCGSSNTTNTSSQHPLETPSPFDPSTGTGCLICANGVANAGAIAGYSCVKNSGAIEGDSNLGYTEQECLTAEDPGTWTPYTCGQVQEWGYTQSPGAGCDEYSYFWNYIAPMSGSPSPVTCCAVGFCGLEKTHIGKVMSWFGYSALAKKLGGRLPTVVELQAAGVNVGYDQWTPITAMPGDLETGRVDGKTSVPGENAWANIGAERNGMTEYPWWGLDDIEREHKRLPYFWTFYAGTDCVNASNATNATSFAETSSAFDPVHGRWPVRATGSDGSGAAQRRQWKKMAIKTSKRTAVAVSALSRSKKSWKSLEDSTAWKFLIRSVYKTAKNDIKEYDIKIVLGVDTDDIFWQQHGTALAMKTRDQFGLQVLFHRYERQIESLPFNALMRDAFESGADYLVRVNDDTEFITSGWIALAVNTLQQYDPPNIGVVGPTCHEGNSGILTHDMVHRTHLQIFDTYYPTAFHNWFIDDWISSIYGSDRTTKLKHWVVRHHTEFGTRYKPAHNDKAKLKQTQEVGVHKIRQYIQTQGKGGVYLLQGKEVLSYSLYGSNPRYTTGAVENARLHKSIYPGWTMRVYHDASVPAEILQSLKNHDVELRDMSSSKNNKMSWRFTAGLENDVLRFCSRDIDARLSRREKLAVDAWLKSGKMFHVMRDHPSHSKFPMLGGMWCASKEASPLIREHLPEISSSDYYLSDMDWLNSKLWITASKNVLQHDSFSCQEFGGGFPFPSARIGWEHVGSVYIDGKMREGDVKILSNTQQPPECQDETTRKGGNFGKVNATKDILPMNPDEKEN